VDLLSLMQNFLQTHCSILPSIADKKKHEVEKAIVQKQCGFTAQCLMADWSNTLVEVCLSLPLWSSFTEAVTTITVRELTDTTSYYLLDFYW
jgi:hypothetical protein